jgi:hypothetical protein
MKPKNQKTLKVLPETHKQLKIISDKLGISITEFMAELIGELFPIANVYDGHVVVHYLPSYQSSYTMIQFLGQNRILQQGTFKVSSPLQVAEFEKQVVDNAKIEKTTSFSQIEAHMSKLKNAKVVKD